MNIRIGEHLIEWDTEKNRKNLHTHGIRFETAALVFADPMRIEYHDKWHSIAEDRYIIIGMVDKILFVVYTDRGDASRLISARTATPKEKEIYYGHYQSHY